MERRDLDRLEMGCRVEFGRERPEYPHRKPARPLREGRFLEERPCSGGTVPQKIGAVVGLRVSSNEGAAPGSRTGEEARTTRRCGLDAEAKFSIRWAHVQRERACPRCGDTFLISGPTGFEGEEAICDLCLLEASGELGALLSLALAARIFGTFEAEDPGEAHRALVQYGAFARVYEVVAARSGPPRVFQIPSVDPMA